MNETLKYFQVKCYNGISMHLRIYSINVIEYQLTFLVPLPWTNNPGDDAKKRKQALDHWAARISLLGDER